MGEFCDVEDLEAFLQQAISSEEQIAAASRAIIEATAAIVEYTEQDLEYMADDEIDLDGNGGTRLLLPQLPVISVSSVVEDDTTLTVDDDYKLGKSGILHRIGARWAVGIQNVTVTYTHGYEQLPDLVVSIATRAASRAYQAGLRADEDEGVMGVQSKSLGDFSTTYASEQGGGAGEGVMGASAARLLLLSEKDLLYKFKV